MGIPTGNSGDYTQVTTSSSEIPASIATVDTQAVAATLSVVLEELSAMAEEITAHLDNASEATKEAAAEEAAALLEDPLAPVHSNAGGESRDGDHPSKEDRLSTSTTGTCKSLHKTINLDLTASNNLRANAEKQTIDNQSIYSLGSPEQITEEINSLITSLQSNPKGLSSTTVKTASSHLGIASQLAAQLSNPSQTANTATIREDIQAHVTSAYTAIFTELLANPEQLIAFLSETNTKEAAEAITHTLTEAHNGNTPIPGGNFMEVLQALVQPQEEGSPPPPTMQVVSNQKLCDLLGAFAAATQNNQVSAAEYSSKGAINSSNIASSTIASSRGQLNFVQSEVAEAQKKQDKVEKKQKEAGIWQKVGVALMGLAIVITIAVLCTSAAVATAISLGTCSFTLGIAIAVSIILVGIMTTSIAATFNDDCPDLMGLAIQELAAGLVKTNLMSKEDAQIVAMVIVMVLMMVISCGAAYGLAPAAAGQGVAVAGAENVSTTATVMSQAAKLVANIGTAFSTVAKATATAVSEITAQAVAEALAAALKSILTAIYDLIVLVPKAMLAAPEFVTALKTASDTAARMALILPVISKTAAIAGLITSISKGANEIELGQIMISLSKNLANIGTAQANMELMNYITTLQTKQSGVTMESYKGLTERLSSTAIQEAAGAGKTLADQLA